MSGIRAHNLDTRSLAYGRRGRERIFLPADNVQLVVAEAVVPNAGVALTKLAPIVPIASVSLCFTIGEFGTPGNDVTVVFEVTGWDHKGLYTKERITTGTTVESPAMFQTQNAWLAIEQIMVVSEDAGAADAIMVGVVMDDAAANWTGAGGAVITAAPATFVLPRIGVPVKLSSLTRTSELFGLSSEVNGVSATLASLNTELQSCSIDITGAPSNRTFEWRFNPNYRYV